MPIITGLKLNSPYSKGNINRAKNENEIHANYLLIKKFNAVNERFSSA